MDNAYDIVNKMIKLINCCWMPMESKLQMRETMFLLMYNACILYSEDKLFRAQMRDAYDQIVK